MGGYPIRKYIQTLVRHPRLISLALTGSKQSDLAKEHMSAEIPFAERLYDSIPERLRDIEKVMNDPAASLSDILTICRGLSCYDNAFLYTIIRMLRPLHVVETGVRHGVSSTFILAALHTNRAGRLYSIDQPNQTYFRDSGKTHTDRLADRADTGEVVPESLRDRWTLRIGKSEDVLPNLCAELGSIDVFFHDSEHTYKTMSLELSTVWPFLRKGALVIADDVLWDNAVQGFQEFCKTHNCISCICRKTGFAFKL